MTTQLEAVRRYVAQRPPTPPPASGAGHVVVVGSGKGGVGTSTTAALLALLAAADGRTVLLVDAVEELGAQHLLFTVQPERTLAALRGGEVAPRELLLPLSPTLMLLPGGAGEALSEPPLSAAERRALMRRICVLFTEFDLVVIDGGSRLDSVLAACSLGVGRLIAVTAAERISLAATHALVKAVGLRVGELPVDVLVNRHDEVAARAAVAELRAAAEHFLQRSLGYAGTLPDDACLSAGTAAGMPLHEAAAGSPAAAAMLPLSRRLLNDLGARHR